MTLEKLPGLNLDQLTIGKDTTWLTCVNFVLPVRDKYMNNYFQLNGCQGTATGCHGDLSMK